MEVVDEFMYLHETINVSSVGWLEFLASSCEHRRATGQRVWESTA
jgi:hypothetical protein